MLDIIDRHTNQSSSDDPGFTNIFSNFSANWVPTQGGTVNLIAKPNEGDEKTWVYETVKWGNGILIFSDDLISSLTLERHWCSLSKNTAIQGL